jgi:hypothetical protein
VYKKIPKDVVIQVDLKDRGNKDAKEEVIKLIEKYDRVSTSVIGSDNEEDV